MIIFSNLSYAEENISSSGLINLEDIKPSFDALDERNEKQDLKQKLKAKKSRGLINIKINQTVNAFDEAVFDLRREKIKLDADLKSAEMRMLTFFEELNLLKVFAKKDTQLSNRLEKAKTQKSEIVNANLDFKNSVKCTLEYPLIYK